MQERIIIHSKPQSLKSLYIDDSPVGSYGMFTSEDLLEYTCIEIAKAIILPRDIYMNALYSTISYGLPANKLILDQYTIGWSQTHVCIPLGNVGMYNHSDNPNCDFVQIVDRDCVGIVTLKKIRAGEELTVSYGPTWFKQKDYVKKVNL